MTEGVSQQELEQRLKLGIVDDDELTYVLLHRIGHARGVSDNQVDYVAANEHVVLSLRYSRKGRINALVPGVALTQALLDEIEQEVQTKLLTPARSMVHRFPIFAAVPTEGYWRHRDKVVLRRAPDEAPRPCMLMAPHPLVIEVRFDGSDDGAIRHLRAQHEPREFALFLSVLVPWLTVPVNGRKNDWVTTIESAEARFSLPILGRPYYGIPNFEAFVDDLSSQDDLPDIELVESPPTAIGTNEVLTLPRNLPDLIDTFVSLDNRWRRKVLRSAYWLHHARDVWHLSKSASYQALVQAVEVLIEIPQATGLGPTKLFAQFIDRYAPPLKGSEELARKTLYRTRSLLTHGDMLLYMDEASFNQHGPRLAFEYELLDHARSICRRAIVEWLVNLD